MSASGAGLPPLGGMAPLPFSAELYSAGTPCAMRGAQAPLSPNFGAPATPAAWHATQTCLYVPSPLPPAAGAAAAGAAAATVCGCAAAAGVVAAGAAAAV